MGEDREGTGKAIFGGNSLKILLIVLVWKRVWGRVRPQAQPMKIPGRRFTAGMSRLGAHNLNSVSKFESIPMYACADRPAHRRSCHTKKATHI